MPLNDDIEDIFDDEINEDAEQPAPAESNPAQPPQEEPFPEPPQAANAESLPGNAEDFSADLVDDLSEEEEQGSEEVNTEESFAPSKEVRNTKKIMQITALIAGAVLLFVVTIIPQMTKKTPKTEEEKGIVDSDEILKQMREYDERDIKRQQERKPRGEIQETPLPKTEEPQQQPQQRQQAQQGGTPAAPRRQGNGNGGGAGRNAAKDEEILKQYSEIDPGAAASGSAGHGAGLAKLNALPQRQGGGGLNIVRAQNTEKQEKASYYNLELKAKLKFGVRSSGGNSVVATINEAKGDFPEGSIFYGEATFNNKRTFVRFTHAQAGERKIVLDGRAMMGKDPGLPSEVTEIAGQNAESSLKAGAIGVAGQVADNTLANVTQGATRGVLTESTKDLQKQQEEQKKQYEYFVPAGTVFTIYVY